SFVATDLVLHARWAALRCSLISPPMTRLRSIRGGDIGSVAGSALRRALPQPLVRPAAVVMPRVHRLLGAGPVGQESRAEHSGTRGSRAKINNRPTRAERRLAHRCEGHSTSRWVAVAPPLRLCAPPCP